MNTAQLREYLEEAVALEKTVYFQKWLAFQWKMERGSLTRQQERPTPPAEPKNPLPGILRELTISFLITVAAVAGICTALIGFPMGCAIGLLGGILSGLIVAASIYFLDAKQRISEWEVHRRRWRKKKKEDIFQRYERDKLDYQVKTLAYPEKAALAKVRHQVLDEALEEMEAQLEESQAALKAHYAQNVIYAKYRNFVMVCSLCEYIQSGRCDRLEGPHGAYSVLEQELQQQWLVADLNELDWKSARTRQHGAYTALREVMDQAAAMAVEIDRRVEARLGRETA